MDKRSQNLDEVEDVNIGIELKPTIHFYFLPALLKLHN